MAKYLDDAALSELVSQIKALVNTKYTKPSGGIPASDLAESYYLASNPSGYTKVESSSTNGNIKINNTETTVYTLPSDVAYWDDTGTTVLETTLLDSYYNKTESDSRFLHSYQTASYTDITSDVGVTLTPTSLTFVVVYIDSSVSTVLSNSSGLSIEISSDNGNTWTAITRSNSINSYPKFESVCALIPANVVYRWTQWGITANNTKAFKLELN